MNHIRKAFWISMMTSNNVGFANAKPLFSFLSQNIFEQKRAKAIPNSSFVQSIKHEIRRSHSHRLGD
jgi:hypothetical protein